VIYAKLLRDVSTGEYPVVSYWMPTLIVSDNRIPAQSAAQSSYAFALPSAGGIVTGRLWLRRVTADVAATQNWNLADQLLAEVIVGTGSN
jgi:hypothetical protein